MLKVLVPIWFLIEEPMTNVWSGRLRRDLWICTGQELEEKRRITMIWREIDQLELQKETSEM